MIDPSSSEEDSEEEHAPPHSGPHHGVHPHHGAHHTVGRVILSTSNLLLRNLPYIFKHLAGGRFSISSSCTSLRYGEREFRCSK